MTDIDVLAIRHNATFNPDTIAITCKSGFSKSLSPAREIFYLRGVLDYFHAEGGIAAFLNRPIAPHLRDLGQALSVLVLSGNEIQEWCRSLTNGLPEPGYFQESAYDSYAAAWCHLDKAGIVDYLRTDFWFHFDFRNIQNLIGHVRKVSKQLDGQQSWHSLILLDVAAHLCLSVFALCRQVRMLGLATISETTTAFLFGGDTSFKARRDLYNRLHQLLASTGITQLSGPPLPPLEPAYTKTLAELALRFIERPHAARLVPLIIQDSIWRLLGANGTPGSDDKNTLAGEKLAQDLLDFIKTATGLEWVPKI